MINKNFQIVKDDGTSLQLDKADWANTMIIDEWFIIHDLIGGLLDMETVAAVTFYEDKIKKGEEISANNKKYVQDMAKQIYNWCGRDRIKIERVVDKE